MEKIMNGASTRMDDRPAVSNNGGGPEPHQGSNPGAQSDPGPKEVGFYDALGDHMGGDEGVQNTTRSFSAVPGQGGSAGGAQTDTPMQGQDDPRTPGTYPYDRRGAATGARNDAGSQEEPGGLTSRIPGVGAAPSRAAGQKAPTSATHVGSRQQRRTDLVSA